MTTPRTHLLRPPTVHSRRYVVGRPLAAMAVVLVLATVAAFAIQFRYLRQVVEPAEYAMIVRFSLSALVLVMLVALPLLYLGGGRSLVRRFSYAEARAFRDELTGLYNDETFRESLDLEMARSHRFRDPFALVVVNVDDFSFVNDNLGRQTGDDILVALADALRTGRSVDLPYRLGGDEFAVIMPHTDLDGATWAVTRLRREAFRRMGGITVSMGLAVFDPDDLDADAAPDGTGLRTRAALALAEAKHRGRDGVVTYAEISDAPPPHTSTTTVTAVRHLLLTRLMDAEYQPIWNLETHLVLGIEGLARPAPEYGLASPQDAFDGASLIGRVGDLDSLCRQAVLERVRDLPSDVLLFLNVSAEVLTHGAGAAQLLHAEVDAAGLDPARVVVELSRLVERDLAPVTHAVRQLRAIGFHVALDNADPERDRLVLLRGLQPNFVKIDREVVLGARDAGASRAALAATLAYCAEAGAAVIAQRIETEALLRNVVGTARTLGQSALLVGAQGYLLGRPAPEPPWRSPGGMAWPL